MPGSDADCVGMFSRARQAPGGAIPRGQTFERVVVVSAASVVLVPVCSGSPWLAEVLSGMEDAVRSDSS